MELEMSQMVKSVEEEKDRSWFTSEIQNVDFEFIGSASKDV